MENKEKEMGLIKETLEKSKFDKYDYEFLKKCKLRIIWDNFARNIADSGLFMVPAVFSGFIGVVTAIPMFAAIVMSLSGDLSEGFIGLGKLWLTAGGVTALSTLPTVISSTINTNNIIKKAELDSIEESELLDKDLTLNTKLTLRQKLSLFKDLKKLIDLYKNISANIVAARSESKCLENVVEELATENQKLEDNKENLKEEIETMRAEKKTLTAELSVYSGLKNARDEIQSLSDKKAKLVEELQLCSDLNEARKEFAGYQDIRGYQAELKQTVGWLSKQMQTRYYIDGLVIGEAADRETGSISFAPFKQTKEGEKVYSGILYAYNYTKYTPLFNHSVVGTTAKYGKDEAYPQVKILRIVNVSDVLHCMGWSNILTLGTISASELTAVMKYVLDNKETYGFTFNGEINELDSEIGAFNAFLDFAPIRKRALPESKESN